MEINKCYFGKAENIMKNEIPDKFVDHIITDLPYYNVVNDYWDNQFRNVEEYLNWVEIIIVEYKRILKDNGNIFLFTGRKYNRKICNILDKYFIEKRNIIWSRKRNFNNTRGKSFSSGYEPISYYVNGDKGTLNMIKIKTDNHINRKDYNESFLKDGINLSDVWDDIPALVHNSKEKLKHSSQKPLKLIERLVLIGSNENDIILDSCAGTGTVGEACKNLNRNFILIENDINSFNIMNNRLI